MKRYLLFFLCPFLLIGCSSTVKTNSLVGVGVSETEVEVLPVTADLAVSEQKVIAVATGNITDIDNLTKAALAQALGQGQPSVTGADVLVGQHSYTEANGTELKITLTGYPAYFTNFRTATKADSLLLSIYNSGPSPDNKPQIGALQSGGEWYFSLKYQFGDGFGWGLGAGKSWPSNALQGDFFFGLEVEEKGLLSPWKIDGDEYWYSDEGGDWEGLGGSLNAGGIYGGLPNNIKLVYGLSAGVWWSEYGLEYDYSYQQCYNSYYSGPYCYTYNDTEYISEEYLNIMVGPFVKARWYGLEAGLRFLFGTDSEVQFAIGYTY